MSPSAQDQPNNYFDYSDSKDGPQSFESETQKKQRSKWTPKETWLYLLYIAENKEILEKTLKIQKHKVYTKMNEFIQTRLSGKCKSHHQKLLKKYGSIDKILELVPKQKKWTINNELQNLFAIQKPMIKIGNRERSSDESSLSGVEESSFEELESQATEVDIEVKNMEIQQLTSKISNKIQESEVDKQMKNQEIEETDNFFLDSNSQILPIEAFLTLKD